MEVLDDIKRLSKATVSTILPIFDIIKTEMVIKWVPMLDKKEFTYYLNGVMACCDVMKKHFAQASVWKEEIVSDITRKVLNAPKDSNKPWKVRKII